MSFVCLYPINVKTNEPIRPKFCVGPHMTPGKVYGISKLERKNPGKWLDFFNAPIRRESAKI